MSNIHREKNIIRIVIKLLLYTGNRYTRYYSFCKTKLRDNISLYILLFFLYVQLKLKLKIFGKEGSVVSEVVINLDHITKVCILRPCSKRLSPPKTIDSTLTSDSVSDY